MPWKDNYTTSDEIGMRDGTIVWPEGQQMALGLTVNLNPAGKASGISAKDLAYPTWHFGLTRGLDNFLALLANALEVERLSKKIAASKTDDPVDLNELLLFSHGKALR